MSPLSAHEAGLVCLQVLESGGSVSSSVLFEYRARNASSLPSSQLDWLSLDGECQSPPREAAMFQCFPSQRSDPGQMTYNKKSS